MKHRKPGSTTSRKGVSARSLSKRNSSTGRFVTANEAGGKTFKGVSLHSRTAIRREKGFKRPTQDDVEVGHWTGPESADEIIEKIYSKR